MIISIKDDLTIFTFFSFKAHDNIVKIYLLTIYV